MKETAADKLTMPTAAEMRKRHLWREVIQWLRFELNSRFKIPLRDRENWLHLEEMAATIINNGEVFDTNLQQQLERLESQILTSDSLALRTPVFIKTPPDAVLSGTDVVSLYDRLAGINDNIEIGDDGYARFGSLNDMDEFREIVREIENKRSALVFPTSPSLSSP